MHTSRDVGVEFEELDAAHNGRKGPLLTGARPQFFYLGHDWVCQVEIIAPGTPNPRIGVRAYLAFGSPREHVGRLAPGSPFLLREGGRTVAFGTVTQIIDLEESARNEPVRYSPTG